MPLHFSAGKLLLKNVTNEQWYFLDVRIGDDLLPHLHPFQDVAGDYSLTEYDEYAILRANNGDLYKLGLMTNESGKVTFTLDLADWPVSQLPIKLYLRDSTTDILYSVVAFLNDLDQIVYPKITAFSAVADTNGSRAKVCNCPLITTISFVRNYVAASVLEECAVVTPVADGPVSFPYLRGANGELLLDANGRPIRA